ncbi:MAG: TonB-dependent receptor, partial [Verrucomicrobia bacterium]|nr:TonB-dependent receptor [Verrucomicrobiota bacterium]
MMTTINRHSFSLLAVALVLGALAAIRAADAPRPSLPPPPVAGEEIIELSPFTVNTSRDVGYVAENTVAGSRLNSQLRDTASSLSVFTKEFLDDLAITDIRELVQYTVNGEMNTNENQAGSGQNPVINAQSLTPPILTRGAASSLGSDYFTSITPTDPYRVGRYEDSRGPNSIMFGIGSPGGLLNESSKTASTARDATTVRYSGGSFDRHRLELDGNRVLRRDRLAVSLAAVLQESGGWRAFDFQDKKRLFGSITVRPTRTIKVTAMGEVGRDINAVIRNTVETDEALAWYDNREARGVGAVTFTPNNTVPTAALLAVGVTARDGNRTGNNRRAILIENDGTVFDAIGTFLSGSYNNAAVFAPDGTP